LKLIENQENYNCRVVTTSGDEYLVYANWLHNEKLDNWKGWVCDAGATRISIDQNFNIYSGECRNDSLGNALGEFTILENTVCKKDRCTGCTDDLVISKHKP
jgi:hypothetical protein